MKGKKKNDPYQIQRIGRVKPAMGHLMMTLRLVGEEEENTNKPKKHNSRGKNNPQSSSPFFDKGIEKGMFRNFQCESG